MIRRSVLVLAVILFLVGCDGGNQRSFFGPAGPPTGPTTPPAQKQAPQE